MNRGLMIGINTVGNSTPLHGCVNDANDIATFLTSNCGFRQDEIRLLTDTRATTAAILERLAWAVQGVRPGDRIVISYSGHGAQYAGRNTLGQVDRLHDVICPYDFDWTEQHMITDSQIYGIFKDVPPGVQCVFMADACHSGDLTAKSLQRRRSLVVPGDMDWRVRTARTNGLKTLKSSAGFSSLHIAFLAACKSAETAGDTVIDGEPCGAFTHFLLSRLRASGGLTAPLTQVMSDTSQMLMQAGYKQDPEIHGAADSVSEPFPADGNGKRVSVGYRVAPFKSRDPEPGHVVFYRRNDWQSRAIAHFDHTQATHVAIHFGDGNYSDGITSRDGMEVVHVSDAWLASGRMKQQNTTCADSEDLVLALLSICRPVTPTANLGVLVGRLMNDAILSLNRYTATDCKPKTCSETVQHFYVNGPENGRTPRDTCIAEGSILHVLQAAGRRSRYRIDVPLSADKSTAELFAAYEGDNGEQDGSIDDIAFGVQDYVNRFAFALLHANDYDDVTSHNAINMLVEHVQSFVSTGDLLRGEGKSSRKKPHHHHSAQSHEVNAIYS